MNTLISLLAGRAVAGWDLPLAATRFLALEPSVARCRIWMALASAGWSSVTPYDLSPAKAAVIGAAGQHQTQNVQHLCRRGAAQE